MTSEPLDPATLEAAVHEIAMLRAEMAETRIPALEKMAREANRSAVEQWNRADALAAENAALREQIQRVRELHKPMGWTDSGDGRCCDFDGFDHPCQTLAALDGDQPKPGEPA